MALCSCVILVLISKNALLLSKTPFFSSSFFPLLIMGKGVKKLADKGKSKKNKEKAKTSSGFGPSSIKDKHVDDLVKSGAISGWNVVIRPISESSPTPRPGYTLVFENYFDAGFKFPCSSFLIEVLKLFGLEFSQLNPNALVRLGIFEWII